LAVPPAAVPYRASGLVLLAPLRHADGLRKRQLIGVDRK
jgi:hypothetical protein